jgi:hypothetical protein
MAIKQPRPSDLSLKAVFVAMLASWTRSAIAAPPASSERLSSPDFFPVLPWDFEGFLSPSDVDRKAGVASIAECNFTIAGFVTPEALPE